MWVELLTVSRSDDAGQVSRCVVSGKPELDVAAFLLGNFHTDVYRRIE